MAPGLSRPPLKWNSKGWLFAAAVSVGIVNGQPLLDLCYNEDVAATVDMNLVMNSAGEFIELQGSGEEATFSESQLADLLALGKTGIKELLAVQQKALA